MGSRSSNLPDVEKMEALFKNVHDFYTVAILRLAWQAGLIPSEISDLKWTDVNFDKKELTVDRRTIPMCDEVARALSVLEKDSEYVFWGSKNIKMSRVTISRKAREELDSVGLADVRLLDLRNAYVIELLQTIPIEEVSRITGCEIVSLQQLYIRYAKEHRKFNHTKKEYEFNRERLEQALLAEKGSLDAQIIIISWTTGLSLEELSEIRWGDIDMTNRIIKRGDREIPIPKILADSLSTRTTLSKGQYVFCSTSGRKLARWFCSRRAREFFIRHNMENLSLTLIRGKYTDPSDQQLFESIMQLANKQPFVTIKEISRLYGIGAAHSKKLLGDLVNQESLWRFKNGTTYTTLKSAQTNWEKIMQVANAYLLEHETLPISILSQETGFEVNYLAFYIKKAISMGLLERCGRGLYRHP